MSKQTIQSQYKAADTAVKLEAGFYPLMLSVEMYEFFMANGEIGQQAQQLYLHLQYTARRQKTNQVWANTYYLTQGLGWGKRKLKAVKAFLSKHGLIDYIQPRKDRGRVGKTYIRLNYIHKKETVLDALRSIEQKGENDTGGTDRGTSGTGGTTYRTTRPGPLKCLK
jgi:hypothetical protein